jgi:(p)ppGpp synthase/HD superfamily hydrolase
MQSRVNNEKIMNSLIVEAILTKSASKRLDIELIESAYKFAEKTIGDLLRDDRTKFIAHFVRVAAILILELEEDDSEIIAAGFLHALPTHTNVSYQILEEKFSKRISDSIDLLTIHSEDDDNHAGLVKSLEESSERMGAIVKLSDRLDNIRRLRFADRPGKQEFYIRQTENIYLPFAKKTHSYIYEALQFAIEKLKANQY